MEHVVTFPTEVTFGAFERTAASHFTKTIRSETAVFDLRSVRWLGNLPTELLYAWVSQLTVTRKGSRRPKRAVSLLLPEFSMLPDQVRSALVENGMLAAMERADVTVPQFSLQSLYSGLPVTVLDRISELKPALEYGEERLAHTRDISMYARAVLNDAFRVVVYEIAENAFLHTDGSQPHFQVRIGVSAGPRLNRPSQSNWGVITPFPKGTLFVEVILGDFGRGIEAKLGDHLPKGYKPPFTTTHVLTPSECIIAYAFNFSSTSDPKARQRRIEETLAGGANDAVDIATGLFLVDRAARERAGQVVVRTPRGILSLDYTHGAGGPVVKGSRALGLRRLARVPGTHFLLRLPLVSTDSLIQPTHTNYAKAPKTHPAVTTLHAFPRDPATPDKEALVHACDILSRHFDSVGKEVYTLIMPSRQRLSPRAEALFVNTLRAMSNARGPLIWLQPTAGADAPKKPLQAGAAIRVSRHFTAPILAGDLAINEFLVLSSSTQDLQAGFRVADSLRGVVALVPIVYEAAVKAYNGAVHTLLVELLSSTPVRHHPGPFLIEAKYYTNTFFEIGRALQNPIDVTLFAEWFATQLASLSSPPDVLVSITPTVNPLLSELANTIARPDGRKPHTIECHTPTATWLMVQLMAQTGKSIVIVTDVICRGQHVNRMLSLMPEANISTIVTFVDARPEGQSKTKHWHGQLGVAIPIVSALTHPLNPRSEPERNVEAESGTVDGAEERVFVIDRHTRAPTLYARTARAPIGLKEILQADRLLSDSLICGHSEYAEHHYEYYLHFPPLFALLQPQLKKWIREQVDYVSKTSLGPPGRWHAAVSNPDGSLDWLDEFLPSIEQAPAAVVVREEDLRAPPPPTSDSRNRGHWLVVLPALASGHTAQRSVEYASRHNPLTILVLAIVSRMESDLLTFMTQISQYGGVPLRVARFMDFPVTAYRPNAPSCPLCAAAVDLQTAFEAARHHLAGEAELVLALDRKVIASASMQLPLHGSDQPIAAAPSPTDLRRTYFRVLYSASREDLHLRQELTRVLEDPAAIDDFLQTISVERLAPDFRATELQRRLPIAFAAIIARCHDIIESVGPPYPLARVLGALLHLVPLALAECCGDLISRFASSPRDVEELCFALLLLKRSPPNASAILAVLQGGEYTEVAALFSQALRVVERVNDPNSGRSRDALDALCHLWAELFRSGTYSYAAAVDRLVRRASDPTAVVEAIAGEIRQVCQYWEEGCARYIRNLEGTTLWRHFSAGAYNEARLAPLHSLVAQLARHGTLGPGGRDDPEAWRTKAQSISQQIKISSLSLGKAINRLFANPVRGFVGRLPDTIVADGGRRLSVSKSIDYYVGEALCDSMELNNACAELVENWKKHSGDGTDTGQVRFQVIRDHDHVLLEFADSFPGTFVIGTVGGLRSVATFCEHYGGQLEFRPRDAAGMKAAVIRLWRVPAEFGPGDTAATVVGEETL